MGWMGGGRRVQKGHPFLGNYFSGFSMASIITLIIILLRVHIIINLLNFSSSGKLSLIISLPTEHM